MFTYLWAYLQNQCGMNWSISSTSGLSSHVIPIDSWIYVDPIMSRYLAKNLLQIL